MNPRRIFCGKRFGGIMKSRIGPLALSLVLAFGHSGAMAGGAIAGATEITQIQNNVQLIMSYTQQVQGYVRQGLQLQAELKNLINNPTSLLGPEIGQMINNIGSIWKGANSIGYSLGEIDKNFATMFKSSKAGDFAKMFTSWHATNTKTLESGLKAIGAIRENHQQSQNSLSELYNRSQNTSGNLDSLQTIAQVNIRQIQELQQLQELMASQSQASMTYLATQNAKEQKNLEDMEGVLQPMTSSNIPKAGTSASPKWKGFGR
jgi:P-type conjugative transfer protein TrbJ